MYAVANIRTSIVASAALSLARPSSTVGGVGHTATPAGSDTIEISGRGLLESRLPSVAGESGRGSGSIYSFLTTSDREMLATVYKARFDAGADLQKVDALAFDLAVFRSSPLSLDKVGVVFDSSGAPLEFGFSADDEAIAQRILMSTAINDTAIPSDFLRHILDAGLAPGDHAVDFAFLEELVYSSSATGADGAADPRAVLSLRPAERLALMRASGAFVDTGTTRTTGLDDLLPEEGPTLLPPELLGARSQANQTLLYTLLRPSGDQHVRRAEATPAYPAGHHDDIPASAAPTLHRTSTPPHPAGAEAVTNLNSNDEQVVSPWFGPLL